MLPERAVKEAKVRHLLSIFSNSQSYVIEMLVCVYICVYVGERPGTGYVLLYEAAGGDGDLFGSWEWVWAKRWNLSLQVRVLLIKTFTV